MYNTEPKAIVGVDELIHLRIVSAQKKRAKSLALIKKGIWLYFWLLLFEGALRKWILPGLATPLLLIREPVAIWLLIYASLHGFFKSSFFMTAIFLITIVAFFFTMLTGHGNILVALYGARITLVQLPLVFLIGQVFTYEDLIKMGKAFLWTAILQTIIATLQFYSPQSAWINKGIGGDVVKGFSGGGGFFRPPGTFSFTNGLAGYYGLVAPFVFYFWLAGDKLIQKWLLIAGSLALLIAIPISISRTLFFEVCLTALFTVFISTQRPQMVGPIIGATIGLGAVFLLLNNLGFFQTGVAAFTDRFTSATNIEEQGAAAGVVNNIADRFLGGLVGALENSDGYPFFGLGLGMGTNVGSQLLTGKLGFAISEGEWGRVIGEMGVLLGMLFILIRTYMAFNLLSRGYQAIRHHNYLPWLLVSYSFTLILQAQFAQPTSLGFAVLSTGLTIAAFNTKKRATN